MAEPPVHHPDVIIPCASCKRPTSHTFTERVYVATNTYDLTYECMRCSTTRVFGRES